jgi:hypothetical protein
MLEDALFERRPAGWAPADNLGEATVFKLVHIFQAKKSARSKLLTTLTSSMHASPRKLSGSAGSSSHRQLRDSGEDTNDLLVARERAATSEQLARSLQQEVEAFKGQLNSCEERAAVCESNFTLHEKSLAVTLVALFGPESSLYSSASKL